MPPMYYIKTNMLTVTCLPFYALIDMTALVNVLYTITVTLTEH